MHVPDCGVCNFREKRHVKAVKEVRLQYLESRDSELLVPGLFRHCVIDLACWGFYRAV